MGAVIHPFARGGDSFSRGHRHGERHQGSAAPHGGLQGGHPDGDSFLQDMCQRGLGDPLLVVSDRAAGIVITVETCSPRSARQRCLAHRMRNLAAKVPEDIWPKFKARATAAYQAPSRAITRDLASRLVADFETELPSASACFMDDFEACIAHLRMPAPTAVQSGPRMRWTSAFFDAVAGWQSRGRPRGEERRSS